MPLDDGPQPLDVYWNRVRTLWSVRRRRLVVEHTPSVTLVDCRLHASEAARVRCERARKREVHAWAVGYLADGPRPPEAIRIGYRPAEAGFRRRDTNEVVNRAVALWFEADGSAWALSPTASQEPRP